MSVTLVCDCGRTVRAAEGAADKGLRCPECGRAMTRSARPSNAPTADLPVAKVRVPCGCGKTLLVRGDFAGKSVTCPGCDEQLVVPKGPKTAVRAETPTMDYAPGEGVNPPASDVRRRDSKSGRLDAPTLDEADGGAAPAVVVGRQFGEYEIVEEIARGGMGVVFKARQKSPKRLVALKMILAGQLASEEQVRRFRVEAEQAGKLDHPNIVPIHQVGEIDGQHFFSMKLVEGGSLSDRIDRYKTRPREAARLMASVARAVHYAHQRGILHRDLKPGNILLDESGEPHITDFGLAKHMGDEGATQSGAILGTPGYMAPEQASGEKDLTVAADVHGLGAVLYDLLTGHPPFEADTTLKVIMQVIERDAGPLRPHNPAVPADLETICLKCLAKDPRSRYGSAEKLADDLDRFLAGEPIRARPVGAVERVAKWARRRPAAAALVGVCVLASVALLGGGLWYSARLQVALADAERSRAEAEVNAARVGREREKAEGLYRTSLQTVDDMMLNLDGRLEKLPNMDSVRLEFLNEFLKFSRQLQSDRPDDPTGRRQIGKAFTRIAAVRRKLKLPGSDEQVEEAVRVLEGVVREFPRETAYLHELGLATAERGMALRAGDPVRARAWLEKALAYHTRAAADKPETAIYRQYAARMKFEIANLLDESGRRDEAAAAYEAARVAQQSLADRPAAQAYDFHYLGLIHDSLSGFHESTSPAEARKHLLTSLDARREARRRKPDDPLYIADLSAGYATLRDLLFAAGQANELADGAARLAEDSADATGLYNAACYTANAASLRPGRPEGDAFAARAVELLERSTRSETGLTPQTRIHIDIDPDFDPVRGRDDFKALLARLDERLVGVELTPERELQAYTAEFEAHAKEHARAVRDAVTVARKRRVAAKPAAVGPYYPRLLALARKHPESPAALSALEFVLTKTGPAGVAHPDGPAARKSAVDALVARHASGKIPESLLTALSSGDDESDRFLEAVVAANPYRAVRGRATLALASSMEARAARLRKTEPAAADLLRPKIVARLEAAMKEFGDVPVGKTTLAAVAKTRLLDALTPIVGGIAPAISGKDIDGKPLRLADFRGKVVVVSFWANWCGFCRQEYATNRDLVERHRGKPFALLGVNGEDDLAELRALIGREKITWVSWFDADRAIRRAYRLTAYPTTYVIDGEGVIRHKNLRGKALADAVDVLLAEKQSGKK